MNHLSEALKTFSHSKLCLLPTLAGNFEPRYNQQALQRLPNLGNERSTSVFVPLPHFGECCIWLFNLFCNLWIS